MGNIDDQHRNTNMNDKDHPVGQLTTYYPAMSAMTELRICVSCVHTLKKYILEKNFFVGKMHLQSGNQRVESRF